MILGMTDTPWLDEADRGYAFQACNVNVPSLGQFNELEYHAPAATAAPGPAFCRDESRVWAFRGPAETVRRAAAALLGPCGV